MSGNTTNNTSIPRPGMLATVRNRRGTVTAIEPFDGEKGRLHLVHIDYQDGGSPPTERLVWELEPNRALLEPNALPDPSGTDPMPEADFAALLHAARWTALSPYLGFDGTGRKAGQDIFASPFHGGVRVEDFQLVPLIKALRMPRVSLLIADDVGLGKTIEAGLILTELLLRRRIRRVLVLTPAALRNQWKEELWEKFSLAFEVVDRKATETLRRRLGIDANPWRSFSRIIASYHYLRQPDVREQFLSACVTPDGSPHLPWDLLIVDECHNLMPSPFGPDSQLSQTLSLLAPRFEHRIFLSATPHNGYTRSFTGLLEMLDPVRFSRTHEMSQAMRQSVDEVVIRRLKRDINAGSAGPRFCTRKPPRGLRLDTTLRESELEDAFDAFRSAVGSIVRTGTSGHRAGSFAVEVLGKRLLSCPAAFADSWHRTMQGMQGETASDIDVIVAERVIRQETGDDREAQQRQATAATVVGGWLRNHRNELASEISRIQRAVVDLGFKATGSPIAEQIPAEDSRFEALTALIWDLLLRDSKFRCNERLIVFTEYKTTLDYLANRLRQEYSEDSVLTLFGAGGPSGMGSAERDSVKAAFNDPDATVRILVATDAASEGLNLHRTARYLLHYDCPWNPSRLEQRNGRLDRYGQARDVTVHHFDSNGDNDIRFLAHVIEKADEIREDLGSANEVFDNAVRSRLIEGKDRLSVQSALDFGVHHTRAAWMGSIEQSVSLGRIAAGSSDQVRALAEVIDLNCVNMAATLESAMAATGHRPQLDETGEPELFRIRHPDLPGWKNVIDRSVRQPRTGRIDELRPVRQIAFGPSPFMERLGDLDVYGTRPDAILVHLAHPMMTRALGMLTRRRFPGEGGVSFRWTVRLGDVPPGAEALILLTIEELGVNELRESFHHWVRTIGFPVRDGQIGNPLVNQPSDRFRDGSGSTNSADWDRARELLESANHALRRWLRKHQVDLTKRLRDQLKADEAAARKREDQRYRQRVGEVSKLIERSTAHRLEREIRSLQAEREQGQLFDESGVLDKLERSIDERRLELERRRGHYQEIRDQLQRERSRILNLLLPARFALTGGARVFPIMIEVRLPQPQRVRRPSDDA